MAHNREIQSSTLKGKTMRHLAYAFTVIGSLIGGYELLNTMAFADSAPQQAAGAGMALAWAVLPYCFARAVEKLGEITVSEALDRHFPRQREEHLKNR
jgi:hypothetical protein